MSTSRDSIGRGEHQKQRLSRGPSRDVQCSHDAGEDKRLAELSGLFAAFRSTNTSRRRIPPQLRQAVLRALDDGLDAARVRYSCGVKVDQIEDWRGAAVRGVRQPGVEGAASPAGALPTARVLPVVDACPEAAPPPAEHGLSGAAAMPSDSPVTLVVSGWSITLHRLPT